MKHLTLSFLTFLLVSLSARANNLGQTVIPAGTYRGKNGKIYLPAISEASAGLYLVQMRCGEVQHTAKLTR